MSGSEECDDQEREAQQLAQNEEKIEITVDTVRGSIQVELPKSTLINKVIEVAVENLGLGTPEIYELLLNGVSLNRAYTLKECNVRNGDVFDLARVTVVGCDRQVFDCRNT